MIGTALSAIHTGLTAEMVRVEADVSGGFPRFGIVGLPDSAVRESALRIRSAFRNSGLQFPQGRTTVNLSPANIRKRGSGLDLAIAIAILRATGQIPQDDGNFAFLAELQLQGSLGTVESIVALALRLEELQIRGLFISTDQAIPSELSNTIAIHSNGQLNEVVHCLTTGIPKSVHATHARQGHAAAQQRNHFLQIRGRHTEKRILAISAVGHHSLLLLGPPGIGKTLLATNLVHLLPDLPSREALASYAIQEVAAGISRWSARPPMRRPHHSVTAAGMIGGGVPPKPGEVTLANHGVLVLDELFEFSRSSLNALREPLADKTVLISRSGRTAALPADFLLCATANPCPCGLLGYGNCRCLDHEIRRYWARCSGPVLDRIEMVVYLERHEPEVGSASDEIQSIDLRQEVTRARQILHQTQSRSDLHEFLEIPASRLLEKLRSRLLLTDRSHNQVVRIARSIAALNERDIVTVNDLEEAVYLRNTNRTPDRVGDK